MHIPSNFVIPEPEGYVGHTHFWERALTRRQFIGTSAVVGGAAITAPLWPTVLVEAGTMVDPRPIPQVIAPGAPFHVQFLGTNAEPSTITDFKGIVGGVDLLGSGVGTDTTTGLETHLFTAIDNRFMQGVYVGVDGKRHHATFGFV
ncbi:MAG: twin-arginine translocation signal domain-containing protein [Candidatus Dormibacteraeota bacterium]|nr:twin-arginine translocation signal domain-containing protein [Candidatus Dormibacteraeota bacterium]